MGCGASKAISSDSNGGFKQEATDFATKDQPTKPSFTEPPSSDQKTLDEKLRSGELLMRHRRGGVSSERVQAKTEDAASDAHTIFASRIKSAGDTEKDPKTRAMLLCATSSCVLFKGMSDTQIDMIIDVMARTTVCRNEVIIREGEAVTGDASDNFYVVGEGAFQIHRSRSAGPSQLIVMSPEAAALALTDSEDIGVGGSGSSADQELVQRRQPGDSFGELALMHNVARQASVTCTSESAVLWALPGSLYREVLQLEALDSIQSIVHTLKGVELLSCLAEDQFNRLTDSFETVHFFKDERIITQGDLANAFYIVLEGTVDCISGGQVVASMTRCDYFGERALLKDEPRAVHVDAVNNVTLAKITRETFIDIFGSLQTLMEQQFTRRVLTSVPILSHLSESERRLVLDTFTEMRFDAGAAIITEGEVGDLFYIVKEGQVECFKDGTCIRTYTTGEYFGERALCLDEPRAATCVAEGSVTCVTLRKQDFEQLLGPLQSVLDHNMLKDTLRTAPLFRYLTPSERESVLDGFEFCDFKQGDLIFRQGEPGVSFVLLREGTVNLLRDGERIGEKCGGEHLGEKSLLYGTVREYDAVVASGSCLAAFLDQAAFEAVMGPISDVLKRATGIMHRDDLEEFKLIGVGTFGKVKLVRDRVSQRIFAMKIISKAKVLQFQQKEHIISEKLILAECDHPFLIQLVATFKDVDHLYMVLEYCPGGELFGLISDYPNGLREADCVFYAGCVMLAFAYLHDIDVIYRDLKPENLLLDTRGYCKICDFGFAKRVKDRTFTMCGTPEYLAPEIIKSKGHGKGVDWWALGILIHEMCNGVPPFTGDTPMQTYRLIIEGNVRFPSRMTTPAKDIVRKLLNPVAPARLGCLRDGSAEVKRHEWFAGLNMPELLRMKLETPYTPTVKDPLDTSNFPEYDEEADPPYTDDGTGWDDEF